jgi:ATP-binding cassette subfamily B protein
MATVSRSNGIAPLEDQEVLDAIKDGTRRLLDGRMTPGDACVGQLALVARYTRLLCFVGLIGLVLAWWAGTMVFLAVMVFRYGQVGGHRKYGRVWSRLLPGIRRSDYLRTLASRAAAAKEIRIFGLVDWLSHSYGRAYDGWVSQLWHERRRLYLWPFLGYTAIGLVVAASTLSLVATTASHGEIRVFDLALGLQATVAALLLAEGYPEADVPVAAGGRTLTAVHRLNEVVAPRTDSGLGVAVGAADPTRLPRTAIAFREVRFRYPHSDRPVFDCLDFELPAGQSTALVGVNGAGKTTLVKLLARLYDVDDGAVTVDGIDLREFDPIRWRRQLSVVLQDFVRYEVSVADNIAFGAPWAPRSSEAIERAARRAAILDDIRSLPQGLSTPLSRVYSGGTDFSGGQWQRIALARALYALEAGATILVLDEPTSALDVRGEAAFFDSFVELTRGVTTLLISHRFSTVRRADRVVVMDAGRIVEQGRHDDLVDAGGRYGELFRLQAQRFYEGPPEGLAQPSLVGEE